MKQVLLITMVVLMSSSIAVAQDFCEGDLNYDGSVAADDITIFLEDCGRNPFNNPCPPDGPAPVPDTGQTKCYDEDHFETDCLRITLPPNPSYYFEGQDGYWGTQVGIDWPGPPRFSSNNGGTFTDKLTGLTWMRDADCFGNVWWQQAVDACKALADGQCGLTDGSEEEDWRLPNRKELESLLDLGEEDAPVLHWSHGFVNVETVGWYWTSTTNARYTPEAWTVEFNEGISEPIYKGQHMGWKAWCVRGGK